MQNQGSRYIGRRLIFIGLSFFIGIIIYLIMIFFIDHGQAFNALGAYNALIILIFSVPGILFIVLGSIKIKRYYDALFKIFCANIPLFRRYGGGSTSSELADHAQSEEEGNALRHLTSVRY